MMKNSIFYLIGFLFLLTGCELHTSSNGKLDGYWHLCQIDTLATGGQLSLSEKRRFWAIQANLLQFSDADDNDQKFLLRFQRKGDSLQLYAPYRFDRTASDQPLTEAEVFRLQPFGMNELEASFYIAKLGKRSMTLATQRLQLHFRRF